MYCIVMIVTGLLIIIMIWLRNVLHQLGIHSSNSVCQYTFNTIGKGFHTHLTEVDQLLVKLCLYQGRW